MGRRITIRDHSAEANLFARRTLIILILVTAMVALIISNLYYLQITRFEDYQTRSNGNRIRVLPVAPNRGLIYDRNGILLAENRPTYTLEVIPERVDELEDSLAALQQLLALSDEDLEEFRQRYKSQRRFKPVMLKNDLSEQQVARFAANQHKFAGVQVEARLSRHYPYGDALTHVLGYVARINKKDVEKLNEAGQQDNYAATHDIGKLGIEKYHEPLLHGQVGYQEVEVNSQGRILRTLNFEPPVPGKDLILNIDVNVQLAAQKALSNHRGSVVVLDPRDGGVIALYSNPSYDPNLFVHGISRKNYGALLASGDRPLINRATQGRYPPASTVKPHLALLGLEEGVIDKHTKYRDQGFYQLKNVEHKWRDYIAWGHGSVNVTKAIEVSCDTYFYDLAYRLGIDRISAMMNQFGFGDYTGIDLYEETDANMPSRGWKKARYNQPWYIGDTISVGIGQSYWTATPLQLAQSLVTLVNKGERLVPQVLRGQQSANGMQIFAPKYQQPIILKQPEHWDTVLAAMEGTVSRPHGTAHAPFIDASYSAAGKTGTAQLFGIGKDEEYKEEEVAVHLRDNALFVGYAPADAPELVVAVVVENAGGGGTNAAPVARSVFDSYFASKPTRLAQHNGQSQP